MSTVKKHKLGKALLVLGLVLVVAAVAYAAVQYPWDYVRHTVFGSEVSIPSDPAPLEVPYTFPPKNTVQSLPAELPPAFGQMLRSRPRMGLTLLGTIKIPLLGVSENIVEGTGDEMLYAVGHIRGTAYPGQSGNSVLCAHRDYLPMHPFSAISKLSAGDTILLADADNRYTYEVFDSLSVKPQETQIAEPVEGESHLLTLVTSSPTYLRREVVRARLIATEPLE